MLRHFPLLLICFLPFCFLLGHDIYLFLTNPDQQFFFSSIGNIWAVYSPESLANFISKVAEKDVERVAEIESLLEFRVSLMALTGGIVFFCLVAFESVFFRLLFFWVGKSKAAPTRNQLHQKLKRREF